LHRSGHSNWVGSLSLGPWNKSNNFGHFRSKRWSATESVVGERTRHRHGISAQSHVISLCSFQRMQPRTIAISGSIERR
jgi:hypothetical protein